MGGKEKDGRGRDDTWETRPPSFGLRRGKESQGGLFFFPRGSGQRPLPFFRCPRANSRLAFPATASIFLQSAPSPCLGPIPSRACLGWNPHPALGIAGRRGGRERREKGRRGRPARDAPSLGVRLRGNRSRRLRETRRGGGGVREGRLASPRGRTPKVTGEALGRRKAFFGPSLPRRVTQTSGSRGRALKCPPARACRELASAGERR